jgi:hypothetical protein
MAQYFIESSEDCGDPEIITTLSDVMDYCELIYGGEVKHIIGGNAKESDDLRQDLVENGLVDLRSGDVVYVVIDHDSKETMEACYVGYYFNGRYMSHLILFNGGYYFYGDNQFTYGTNNIFDKPIRVMF